MAYGPNTLWEINRETVETVTDFICLGSKITVDGDCSHEIKRHLLLGRKVITNLDSILKSRDIACQQSPSSQGYILSPCLFNFYTSGETLGWKKHKLESRLLGKRSITSDMQMTPPLWQKVKKN